MSKFHVGPSGNPGRCIANEGNCPYGADAPHYDSVESARKGYENSQSAQIMSLSKHSRPEFETPENVAKVKAFLDSSIGKNFHSDNVRIVDNETFAAEVKTDFIGKYNNQLRKGDVAELTISHGDVLFVRAKTDKLRKEFPERES